MSAFGRLLLSCAFLIRQERLAISCTHFVHTFCAHISCTHFVHKFYSIKSWDRKTDTRTNDYYIQDYYLVFLYLLLIFEFTEFQIPSADFKQLIYTSQKISMIHKYWQKQRKKCISEISMRCNRRAISANQSILHNISIFRRWVLWFKP